MLLAGSKPKAARDAPVVTKCRREGLFIMGSQFKGVKRLNSVVVKPTVIDVACAVKRKYPSKHPVLP